MQNYLLSEVYDVLEPQFFNTVGRGREEVETDRHTERDAEKADAVDCTVACLWSVQEVLIGCAVMHECFMKYFSLAVCGGGGSAICGGCFHFSTDVVPPPPTVAEKVIAMLQIRLASTQFR